MRLRWMLCGAVAAVGTMVAGAAPSIAADNGQAGIRETPHPGYWYKVQVVHSEKCLDVAGRKFDDGAKVVQYNCSTADNRQWNVREVRPGEYTFAVRHSGKCLDVAGSSQKNGAQVVQYRCQNTPNQRWRLIPAGHDTFMVQAVHSDKCLDVAAAHHSNGTQVVQYSCQNSTNQRWRFIRT